MAENRIRGTPGNSRPGWWAGCKQPGCIYGQDGNCPDIRRCLKGRCGSAHAGIRAANIVTSDNLYFKKLRR